MLDKRHPSAKPKMNTGPLCSSQYMSIMNVRGPTSSVTGLDDLRDDRGLMDIVDRTSTSWAGCRHRYRANIGDGDALAVEVHRFRHLYNTIRPHQALVDRTPAQVYTAPGGGPGLVSA
jgi:hypothetical protein